MTARGEHSSIVLSSSDASVFVLFYFIYFLLEACLFSNEGQEECGSRREGIEEELLEVEEGETRIRIYCVRKGLFSIQGKKY